jgi:5-hydroxyisourate hydrolase
MGIALQILDSTYGQAAADIPARLERACAGGWALVGAAATGSTGRIAQLCEEPQDRGLYRLSIDSGSYFASLGVSSAYPEIIIVFRAEDESSTCQITVQLSPYSFSANFVTMAQLGSG